MCAAPARYLVVDDSLAGIRLEDFLQRALPDRHPLDVRQQVAAGGIAVNGSSCTSNQALRAGDVVELLGGPPASRPRQKRVGPTLPEVLFESAHCLVVHKPSGTPTVPDRSGKDRGIHGRLEALRPGADLRIVHRLDRDTSGCLILAKGIDAARHFDAAFSAGDVAKTYVALVHGVPAASPFSMDAWLGPDRRRPGKVVASNTEQPGFRAAHTQAAVRTAFRRHALLELRPTTGRGHQLRVHLQAAGHPIVGDADYGGEPLLLSELKAGYKARRGVPERPLTPRLFLHAEQLRFRDLDGADVHVAAALPSDLSLALRQLAAHDAPRRPPCD